MKRTFANPLTAAVLLIVLGFTNCKKEQGAGNFNEAATRTDGTKLTTSMFAREDRILEIVKDLSESSYSLNFDKAVPTAGITRTAYGADNYLVYADPQDLICPEPFRKFQKNMPVWRIPKVLPPTCPDMIYDPLLGKKLQEFLWNADVNQFGGLRGVQISNGGVLLADKSFTAMYANMKVDKIDQALDGLDGAKFLILNDPAAGNSVFTRGSYGYANLDEIIFRKYKLNLKDILKPKLIGCFDPEILKQIRERFDLISPEISRGLGINPIENAADIATLTNGF